MTLFWYCYRQSNMAARHFFQSVQFSNVRYKYNKYKKEENSHGELSNLESWKRMKTTDNDISALILMTYRNSHLIHSSFLQYIYAIFRSNVSEFSQSSFMPRLSRFKTIHFDLLTCQFKNKSNKLVCRKRHRVKSKYMIGCCIYFGKSIQWFH